MSRALACRNGASPRVLYAEDQTASRVLTTALLKRMGCTVDAVEDGEQASRKAETTAYDLILLDIEMPVMDGVTAARRIRANNTGTPILALSAFLADSTEYSHWRGAFDKALPKPANSNELRAAISEALSAESKPPLDDPLSALRQGLPAGTWKQLMATVAAEIEHYATALCTADGADAKSCIE
jgi:CheY-like chemotaxis protein